MVYFVAIDADWIRWLDAIDTIGAIDSRSLLPPY